MIMQQKEDLQWRKESGTDSKKEKATRSHHSAAARATSSATATSDTSSTGTALLLISMHKLGLARSPTTTASTSATHTSFLVQHHPVCPLPLQTSRCSEIAP